MFLGDLIDRNPKIVQVLRLVMAMMKAGTAICVPGNHDVKLLRQLRGKNVQITHGLAETLDQNKAADMASAAPPLDRLNDLFRDTIAEVWDNR